MSLVLLALAGCGGDAAPEDAVGVVGNTSTRLERDAEPLDGRAEAPEALEADPAVVPMMDPMQNGGVRSVPGVGGGTETVAASTDPWLVYSPVSMPIDVEHQSGKFDWPFSTKGRLKTDKAQEAEDEAIMGEWRVAPSEMYDDEEKAAAYVKRLKSAGVNTDAIAAAARRRAEAKKAKEE